MPSVVTPRAAEDAVTLEDVGDAWGLVRNLEKIPLPSQLIAVLSDPLLQKLSILRPDATVEVHRRASNWILSFQEDTASGEIAEDELQGVLEMMKDYVISMKASSSFLVKSRLGGLTLSQHAPAAFVLFIQALLPTWQATTGKDEILHILGYVPFLEFDGWYPEIPPASCISYR